METGRQLWDSMMAGRDNGNIMEKTHTHRVRPLNNTVWWINTKQQRGATAVKAYEETDCCHLPFCASKHVVSSRECAGRWEQLTLHTCTHLTHALGGVKRQRLHSTPACWPPLASLTSLTDRHAHALSAASPWLCTREQACTTERRSSGKCGNVSHVTERETHSGWKGWRASPRERERIVGLLSRVLCQTGRCRAAEPGGGGTGAEEGIRKQRNVVGGQLVCIQYDSNMNNSRKCEC